MSERQRGDQERDADRARMSSEGLEMGSTGPPRDAWAAVARFRGLRARVRQKDEAGDYRPGRETPARLVPQEVAGVPARVLLQVILVIALGRA